MSCDPEIEKEINRINTGLELEDEMAFASGQMELLELFGDKSEAEIEMFWEGYNFAERERNARNQSIHQRYVEMFKKFPDKFPADITYRLGDPNPGVPR